ncbi:MAG: GNAT family N-acetyltransferase [Clostridiales bacterium]|nr:GNAT family N-acetyltransferase [Clostridiales bacterium]
MFTRTYAADSDMPVWLQYDRHISKQELRSKMQIKRCYLLKEDETPIGVMRYNLFWDNIPFLNLIYLDASCRGKGYGTLAMEQWEREMQTLGFSRVMTSTQSDETAQFFYRKLGYQDAGYLVFGAEPAELIFMKQLQVPQNSPQ